MDKDGDSVVSFDEFMEACSHDSDLCQQLSRGVFSENGKTYLKKKEVSRLWQLMDTDLDDHLTQEELLAWWRGRALEEDAEEAEKEDEDLNPEEAKQEARETNVLKKAFQRMDTDHDGMVTLGQLVAGCANDSDLCELLSRGVFSKKGKAFLKKKEVSQIFQLIETDRSDAVSQNELNRWWRGNAKARNDLRVLKADEPVEEAAERKREGENRDLKAAAQEAIRDMEKEVVNLAIDEHGAFSNSFSGGQSGGLEGAKGRRKSRAEEEAARINAMLEVEERMMNRFKQEEDDARVRMDKEAHTAQMVREANRRIEAEEQRAARSALDQAKDDQSAAADGASVAEVAARKARANYGKSFAYTEEKRAVDVAVKASLFVERAFARMDRDADGVVKFDEFQEACSYDADLCSHLSRGVFCKDGKPHLNKKEVSRLWQLMDTDIDDHLTQEELLAWWRGRALEEDAEEAEKEDEEEARQALLDLSPQVAVLENQSATYLKQAFARMDAGHTGVVTHEQLTAACNDDSDLCTMLSRGVFSKNGKPFLNKKEVSQIWQLVDTDLDDALSEKELMRWWRSNTFPRSQLRKHDAEEAGRLRLEEAEAERIRAEDRASEKALKLAQLKAEEEKKVKAREDQIKREEKEKQRQREEEERVAEEEARLAVEEADRIAVSMEAEETSRRKAGEYKKLQAQAEARQKAAEARRKGEAEAAKVDLEIEALRQKEEEARLKVAEERRREEEQQRMYTLAQQQKERQEAEKAATVAKAKSDEPAAAALKRKHHEEEKRRKQAEDDEAGEKKESDAMERLFNAMDHDGDGVISFDELSQACSKDSELCLHLTKGVLGQHGKSFLKKKDISRLWQLFDTDFDDFLTQEELLTWWRTRELDLDGRADDDERDAPGAEGSGPHEAPHEARDSSYLEQAFR